jgi:signal transduction histidine kinase
MKPNPYNISVICLIFILLIFSNLSKANIDSLKIELAKTTEIDKIDLLIKLSKEYWTISPSQGMFYANEAIRLADFYDKPEQKAKALLYGGVNAWFMGAYNEAIEYYQKSLSLALEKGDIKLSAYNLNNLGMIYTQMNNYDKALDYYTESSLLIEQTQDSLEYAKILNNIAELNLLLDHNDKALEQHLSVLRIIENSDEKVFLIWVYNNIGNVYKKNNDFALALDYFNKAHDLSSKTNNIIGLSQSLNNIGEIYILLGKYEIARYFLYNALQYAKQSGSSEDIIKTYQNISNYYSTMGHFKESLHYFKLFKQLNDSVLNQNKAYTMLEMQSRYELENAEKENILLKNSIELQDLKIRKSKNTTIFLIVSLFLTIGLILLIFNQLMIKRKKNKELSDKNNLINLQKNELSDAFIELQKLNHILQIQKNDIQISKMDLEKINAALAETNATKDKFFSIIAHDLKSPFNSLLGFSEILEDEFDEYSSDEKKNLIQIIHRGLLDTFKLLENLLQWAQTQRGSIKFEPQHLDLHNVSSEVIELLQHSANSKSITIDNNIPKNTVVYADNHMISTIFRNLLSNALKFTSRGGHVQFNISESLNPNFMTIEVKDNGKGIPEALHPKLFALEEHISSLGTENETGTGLGLILCKEFILKHHGNIWVESKEGIGSSFFFNIPVVS